MNAAVTGQGRGKPSTGLLTWRCTCQCLLVVAVAGRQLDGDVENLRAALPPPPSPFS